MDYQPATTGQIKQIIAKVIQAVPADAFSFEEAERVLRDHRLAYDIACLLRRHHSNKPIPVIPSIRPLDDLMKLVDKFVYVDEWLEDHSIDLEQENPRVEAVLSHIKSMCPPISGMVELEVIGFERGTSYQNILKNLQEMGYRKASLNEAVGFLQARGKTFENVSSGHFTTSHGFVVISDSCYMEFDRSVRGGRKWKMSVLEVGVATSFARSDVLVAKL